MATTEQIKFHKTDNPIDTARSTGQRVNFGRLEEALETPNLIEVQLNSYKDFLQKEVAPNRRKNEGLQAVFSEVFPIESYDEKIKLEFGEYEIGEPKLSPLECQRESQTFAAPLYVTFRLREDKNVKEERVYMGELPLMAPQGTFIINGASASWSASFTARPASASSRAFMPTARCSTATGSSPTAARGSKSCTTPAICSTSIWIVGSAAGNSSSPPSCARSATRATRKSSSFSTPSAT